MTFGPYSKAIVAVIGAVATWATAVLSDGTISPVEWAGLVVPVLTALGVYQITNVPAENK